MIESRSFNSLRIDVFFCLICVKNIVCNDVRKSSKLKWRIWEQLEKFLYESRSFSTSHEGIINRLNEYHDDYCRRGWVGSCNIWGKKNKHHSDHQNDIENHCKWVGNKPVKIVNVVMVQLSQISWYPRTGEHVRSCSWPDCIIPIIPKIKSCMKILWNLVKSVIFWSQEPSFRMLIVEGIVRN